MLPISSMRTPSAVSAGRSRSSSSRAAAVPLRFGLLAILLDRRRIGLQDDRALVAVDDHLVAAGDVAQERADADDRRQFERLGDDRGVASGTADLGDEAENELAIEIGRFAGREIVGQDDDGRSEARKPFAAAAEQMPQQPLFDVEDVAGPVGQPACCTF